ncbi:uncharacterized protein LOC133925900 [Phragmites australis]|uniref:uncharacterized protein LOC133925900 n=1 Tax=Phragmites australis TaxID=29695 RepID=UPI002D792B19|nr:uncharacterized protein LOC133925900 [Phragmites australis]
MGNCLNKASKQRQRVDMMPEEEAESLSEMRRISQVLQEEEEEKEEEAAADEEAPAAEGLKLKIVLTRGELEWLMAHLKSGEQRLEDVLHHMRAIKGAGATRCADKDGGGWRPRLESILECLETAAT